MDKRTFIIRDETARGMALQAVEDAPVGHAVIVQEKTRSLEQNALLWPILRLFSKRVPLSIDGDEALMDEETWKDVLTAAFTGEKQRMASYGGALILVGRSTSNMGKQAFSDFLTYAIAELNNNGIDLPARHTALVEEYLSRKR